MLRRVETLYGYDIRAQDGTIGHVRDLLFDEQTWDVRYLVVQTGDWLSGREVLIIPAAAGKPDRETETLPVKLTREQVKRSPPVTTDLPVSRQKEIELHAHYNWTTYWAAPSPAGLGTAGAPATVPPIERPKPDVADEEEADPHLRSTRSVIDYHVQATDGDVGQVADFIVDDEAWRIFYLVVATGHILPGKKVLLAPAWVTAIYWPEGSVHVDLPQELIENSPSYDPDELLGRAYEERLYDHYARPGYWDTETTEEGDPA